MKLKTILAENVINETLNTDGVIKRTLVNQIYKQIGPITKGFFRDNAWQGIHKVFDKFSTLGLDYSITDSYYGNHKHDNTMPMERKRWFFEIELTNKRGRPDKIKGVMTAAGAGTLDDPLDKYDITVVMS